MTVIFSTLVPVVRLTTEALSFIQNGQTVVSAADLFSMITNVEPQHCITFM